ncbi:MAG: hypothetical protein QM737_04605 [Ferruginibacter sp.]
MKKYSPLLSVIFILTILFCACKKESGNYKPARSLNDYYPLETGKYITYKLDSLVYLNFGQSFTINSYEVKYVVDSLLTDNLGNPAYRVFRYIRKQDPDPWYPSGTFWAINKQTSFEFVENNMRFVKLEMPIEDGTTWKGNEFIDTWSMNSDFQYMDDWDYVYDSVGLPASIGSIQLDNTITVHQCNEIEGFPEIDTAYSQVNYATEKYGLGVGLVYKEFFHNEYQPNPGGVGFISDGSYGITLTMIDHN